MRFVPIDPRVLDPVALAEIELVAELMIAASTAPGPLPAETLDRILGLRTEYALGV